MIRVNIVVEGQTEESFVSGVLAPALWSHQIYLTPILLGVPGHKGGRPNYDRVKKDVILYLKQDAKAYCSTLLDYYGLGHGFPGTPVAENLPNVAKAEQIERAVKEDICARIPEFRADIRFVPYIQLHEYEGLLFSRPQVFATAINQDQLAQQFQQARDNFPTPEDINDDPLSSPSKRILAAYPQYSKVLHGTVAAQAVGVAAMRQECPHFREWLDRLAGLQPL